jgi:hypothetical protein
VDDCAAACGANAPAALSLAGAANAARGAPDPERFVWLQVLADLALSDAQMAEVLSLRAQLLDALARCLGERLPPGALQRGPGRRRGMALAFRPPSWPVVVPSARVRVFPPPAAHTQKNPYPHCPSPPPGDDVPSSSEQQHGSHGSATAAAAHGLVTAPLCMRGYLPGMAQARLSPHGAVHGLQVGLQLARGPAALLAHASRLPCLVMFRARPLLAGALR